MIYILDTNVLIVLFTYFYESRFPTLWGSFHKLVEEAMLVSVREVLNEIKRYYGENRLTTWAKANTGFFLKPTDAEIPHIQAIFSEPRYRAMISQKNLLQGNPVADPFIIAKAKEIDGIVTSIPFFLRNLMIR